MTPAGYDQLNRYARVIVDEALRRGIGVEVVEPRIGELVLTYGERRVTTIESLSELTSAVAFRRCDDKFYTRRVLERAGFRLAPGQAATFGDEDVAFLEQCGELVVKPGRGEGGAGITVGVVDPAGLAAAVSTARTIWPKVLLEQRRHGEDLRVIVIDGTVVAASVRRPPAVGGDGENTVGALINGLSQERAEATGGAASVPLDDSTRASVKSHGYEFETVLPEGEVVPVRSTANVHTGGSIEDVTARLHPDLAAVAVEAAHVIGIPVVGLDFIVPSVEGPDYTLIEANEQPGLANHEPQPTAERFVDLLFPETAEGG